MTMTQEQIQEQGIVHYQAIKKKHIVTPPSYLYPNMDYDDAYAIAAKIVAEYVKDGFTISGKKVGLTSNAMRKLSQIPEPDYGIIFHELCYTNESQVCIKDFSQPGIEAELAFKLKEDLIGKNITVDQVLAATEYVVPCLELVDVRQFVDRPRKIFDTVADNASFGAYIIGDMPIRPYEVDFGLVGFIFEKNNIQVDVACGTAILDHPANAIAWLANKYNSLGSPLKKGELVLCGSAITLLMAHKGDHFRCRYGKFGEVSVSFV